MNRSGPTIAAVALGPLVTAVFVWMGTGDLVLAANPERMTSEQRLTLAVGGVGFGESSAALLGVGISILAVSFVAVIILIGLWMRRSPVREAAIIVFGFLALLAIVFSIGGLVADPPAPAAPVGLAVGLADASLVALLLTRGARREFERVEHHRARRAVRAPR